MSRFYGMTDFQLLEMPVPRFWAYYRAMGQVVAQELRRELSVQYTGDAQEYAQRLEMMSDGWTPVQLDHELINALGAAGIGLD